MQADYLAKSGTEFVNVGVSSSSLLLLFCVHICCILYIWMMSWSAGQLYKSNRNKIYMPFLDVWSFHTFLWFLFFTSHLPGQMHPVRTFLWHIAKGVWILLECRNFRSIYPQLECVATLASIRNQSSKVYHPSKIVFPSPLKFHPISI